MNLEPPFQEPQRSAGVTPGDETGGGPAALPGARRFRFRELWDRLARAGFPGRVSLKLLLFGLVTLFVLYPHPVYLIKQVQHMADVESLIQPSLPAMAEINRAIDKLLPTNSTPQKEFQIVERFVYQKIKYQYDWYNWGNLDYWPTAAEVWDRQREDCDGRAVLAASILRARGFKTARIVANLNHVWVAVDKAELMGPQADKNFRREGDRVILSLPALKTLLDTVAQLSKFPVLRSLIIFFTAVGLLYHPCRNVSGFFVTTTVGLVGFGLLLDWSGMQLAGESKGIDFNFVAGIALLAVAALLALSMNRILIRRPALLP